MRTQLLNLQGKYSEAQEIRASLSLVPFVNFLKERLHMGCGARSLQLAYILDRIQSFPNWENDIPLERIDDFKEVFELIYVTLSPPILREEESVWALTIAFTPYLFFGTDTIYNIIEGEGGKIKSGLISDKTMEERELVKISSIYSLVLQRFYGFSFTALNEFVHQIEDEQSGLNRYYKISFDSRFLDVSFDGELPVIDFENANLIVDTKFEALEALQAFLPLSKMRFSGFSILDIKDITPQHVIDNIKNIIVNLSPEQNVYEDIGNSIKEILGNNKLDVSLMPVLKLNGKLVNNSFEALGENMAKTCERYNFPMNSYLSSLERYSKEPQIIFRKNIERPEEDEDELFPLLRKIGVEGLVVIPVFFQKKLVGILTIYSREKEVLNENMLTTLEPAIPLLEQLLQTTIDDFKITLDSTVKEKFTSLQPSVEWRFNEVAFDFLQHKKSNRKVEIEKVYFSDVYPLYGAIDIRNSTVERNNALSADMTSQLQLLQQVLGQLGKVKNLGLTNELIFKTEQWRSKIEEFVTSDDEFRLNLFFEEEITPFLLHFSQTHPKTKSLIDDYFIAIGPSGVAHNNRRALETSFEMLNNTIGNLLEQMNVEIQGTYPCYFEKYRSDGIEYDIYIGQSITPNQEFNPLYLRNLRLWQLNSMAVIAKLTHALKTAMPKSLETTQLIFVHANTIDISFRNDEHRFDVEGAYNIRYEMIKKRIDKVLIKDSSERLTQPGKISLVYFQNKDVEEYLSHIHYLQNQQILAEEIEFLELEELQGVTGLKALRVEVMMDKESGALLAQKEVVEFIHS